VMGRRGRRRKRLLVDFKKARECYKLEEETLDLTVWRARFGRGENIDVMGRRGRRRKRLLDDLKLYPNNVENWASS
jgi:hypothetical protein